MIYANLMKNGGVFGWAVSQRWRAQHPPAGVRSTCSLKTGSFFGGSGQPGPFVRGTHPLLVSRFADTCVQPAPMVAEWLQRLQRLGDSL